MRKDSPWHVPASCFASTSCLQEPSPSWLQGFSRALAPATALADLSAGTIETDDELVDAYGGSGAYTPVEDITYGGAYPVVEASLTIDLNNHTIDASGERYALYVSSGSLAITGNGTIKGASDCGADVHYGSFIMKGGMISENHDGVCVSNGRTFTMEGGTISGNGDDGISSTGGEISIDSGMCFR